MVKGESCRCWQRREENTIWEYPLPRVYCGARKPKRRSPPHNPPAYLSVVRKCFRSWECLRFGHCFTSSRKLRRAAPLRSFCRERSRRRPPRAGRQGTVGVKRGQQGTNESPIRTHHEPRMMSLRHGRIPGVDRNVHAFNRANAMTHCWGIGGHADVSAPPPGGKKEGRGARAGNVNTSLRAPLQERGSFFARRRDARNK